MDPSTFESFSCSSGANLLTLIKRNEAPESTMNALSFDVVKENEETLLAGLGLKNLFRFSEYERATLYFFVTSNLSSLLVPGCSLLEGWSVWISLILRSSLDDFKCRSQISVFRRTCSRDGGGSLGIGSCHPTGFSAIAPVVHHSTVCEQQSMLNCFFWSAGFAVCLHAHLSPNLYPPGALNFVHSGTCQ